MRDLSVLIPARNERWLRHTVEDVLANLRADTEVIVIADGQWPLEPLAQHPRVQLAYLPEAIGQRAATNLAARLSSARYLMKLDAHCAVSEGFDVALIEAAQTLGDDVTQIPKQYNLHVFDWRCESCGYRSYQGPTPTVCAKCDAAGPFERVLVWNPQRRQTTAWRFDRGLKFQYWGEWGERHRHEEIHDVLSCLGACWFLSRHRYWQIGGLDERHGSWGQMGTELGCKSWLSGGRMVVNKRAWFSHLFRTQGGDFGFPFPLSGAEVDRAREHSRALWLNDAWPGQVRPLSWLIDHFAPVPDWHQEPSDLAGAPRTKGIVYYSDNRVAPAIDAAVKQSIEAAGLPIVAVTLQPIQWPAATNIVVNAERGYLTMFRQILAGLEALGTDTVFLCEHDVVYHPSHFHFTPPTETAYYYNLNVWKVDSETGRAVTYETKQTSGLCATRALLLNHYRTRVALVEQHGFSRRMGFEPGSHRRAERVDDVPSATWRSPVPNVDIRHTTNLTQSRWSPEDFRDARHCQGWQEADGVPGWGTTAGRFWTWLTETQTRREAVV